MAKKDLDLLVAAMQKKTTTHTVTVKAKDLVFTVRELTFKELSSIEDDTTDKSEMDIVKAMLLRIAMNVTVGDIHIKDVTKDVIDAVVDELSIADIKELSDGMTEAMGLGKYVPEKTDLD